MCMGILPACTHVQPLGGWCWKRWEGSVWFPETEFNGCLWFCIWLLRTDQGSSRRSRARQKNANKTNSEIPSYTCMKGQDQKHWWHFMLERMWGKGILHCWWECKLFTVALKISMGISQKISKQFTSRHSNTTFVYIPQGCSIIPQGHVLNYVHSSIICHSQNLETT